ncbi:hypothetical protein [Bacillus sp. ISL-46]|uniref:hypothetical protein n=1 Tax=Bacillus sp. ISL-46 TaxID=2819129 RepID=UPI001BE6A58B|nr:hypothetical protein [Bacillus sp. ISL-46]MBT2724495.1 hypothetical protein [Bacillus sp. ISL-46]
MESRNRSLTHIYNDLIVVKTKDLEECNQELDTGNHNQIVRKALLTYKHELLECLEKYDQYLMNKEYAGKP